MNLPVDEEGEIDGCLSGKAEFEEWIFKSGFRKFKKKKKIEKLKEKKKKWFMP